MSIIYSDEKTERPKHPVDYYKLNATKHYLRHYENLLMLDFVAKKSTDFREKQQANKELKKAESKLEYWRRHPNFKMEEANLGVQQLKRMWTQGNGNDLTGKTGAQ